MYGHELFVWGVWTGGFSMKEGNVKALLLLGGTTRVCPLGLFISQQVCVREAIRYRPRPTSPNLAVTRCFYFRCRAKLLFRADRISVPRTHVLP